jgi:glutamyl-tRNA synthetase
VDFLHVDDLEPDPALLIPKRWDAATARSGLLAARDAIDDAGAGSFTVPALESALRALAEARGWKAGDLFMAIRVAISGRTATPPLFESMVALGRARTLARLAHAAHLLVG